MSEYENDAIEFLPDGVSNRPSAAEQERREHGLNLEMGDHELYQIVNSPDSANDDETADAIRRLYFGLFDLQRSVFNELRLKVSNVQTVADAVRTIDVFCLALGHTTVCGAPTSAALAKKWGKPKETINKPLMEILEKLKLPKLPGQRKDESIDKMEQARRLKIKQLHEKEKK